MTKARTRLQEQSIPFRLKYQLYEFAAQEPALQLGIFDRCYEASYGTLPTHLKEDFCGTFLLSTEWIRRRPQNRATAVDLDPEPLEHGRITHRRRLSPAQQKRLRLLRQDVRVATRPLADVIGVCNFSFYSLHQRAQLVAYLKSCRQSLKQQGIVVLEMVGGPEFVEAPLREQRLLRHPSGPHAGERWFTYFWEQQAFNPIARRGRYAMHFKVAGGPSYRNVFVYDWRVWTLPEVRDCLADAGFSRSVVYWPRVIDAAAEDYDPCEVGDEYQRWNAYVVGVK